MPDGFDQEQFDEIVTKDWKLLCKIASNYLHNTLHEDVEDIVQSALLSVWDRRHLVKNTRAVVIVAVKRMAMSAVHTRYFNEVNKNIPIEDELDSADYDEPDILKEKLKVIGDIDDLVKKLPSAMQATYNDWKAREFKGDSTHATFCRITKLKKALVKLAIKELGHKDST